MRSWSPAVPIAAGYVLSLSVWNQMPDSVVPDWQAIFPLPARESEAMPRAAVAFLFPTIALLVWGLLGVSTRIPGRLVHDAIRRFRGTFAALTTATVSLIVLLHALLLSTVVDWPASVRHALTALLGLGLIAAGNVMPRLRPNWIAGIRTHATLSDEGLWLRTHRWFGILLIGHGVIVLLIGFFAPGYAFLATVLSIITSALGAQLAARRSAAVKQL